MSDASKSDRKVFLGMPGYGRMSEGASRGFWRACRDMTGVRLQYQAGSLLACNFNQLWCAALNEVHHGGRVDYFAMLHDDIGPEDQWLDTLIDELEANNLDVLGVAVPIKDTRGMTSLALHGNDDWMPKARLTMRDVFELPETFTSDDLGGARLLLNTGCWVAKWDQEWAKTVHFEINDRIVFNQACERYQAQTEPEDWHFSRQLHEIGKGPTAHLRPLRIGATRKIRLTHRGEMDFTNQAPWGSHVVDSETVDRSPVPDAFPYEIPGWLRPEEGRALARLATGKRVLEIGSFAGLSTVCLGRTAEHVTAVDYFDGRGTPAPQDTLPTFEHNIQRYGLADKVQTCHPEDPYPLAEYDLAFIDGAHDLTSVQTDIARAFSVLAPDGVLAFHDYRKQPGDVDGRYDAGVTEAVNALLDNGGELVELVGTLAVVKPSLVEA